MSAATTLTREEKSRILDEYEDALDRGDEETARKLIRKIPIHRALVPWVRECFSEEEIQEMGLIMPASGR